MRFERFRRNRRYLVIYCGMILIFSIFYAGLFVQNRINGLNAKLALEQNEKKAQLDSKIFLANVTYANHVRYFENLLRILSYFYKHDRAALKAVFDRHEFASYMAIMKVDGEYLYQSNKDFNKSIVYFSEDSIRLSIAYRSQDSTTHLVLSAPIIVNNVIQAHLIAYFDISFLLDLSGYYLISGDGYLLNGNYIDDIYMGYKNLSFIFGDEWGRIRSQQNGSFITSSPVFIHSELFGDVNLLKNIKVEKEKFYLVYVKSLDPNHNPYHINSLHSFFDFVDFKYNVQYWLIGWIWIILTSIILIRLIIMRTESLHLSSLDALTGAYNRNKGIARLNNLAKKMLDSKPFFSLNRRIDSIHICMIDIDNLKQVNDTLGHKYGDEMIITTIGLISKNLKANEFLIRIGGDEFLLVFINRNAQNITEFWRDIALNFGIKNESGILKYNLSVSHGTIEHKKGDNIEHTIAKADNLMYQEKRKHKVNLFFQ